MTLPTVAASPEALQQLPTPARPRLDPADVVLPAGYRAEVVLAGRSMPCGMGVDDEGAVYVLEGGSTWPTRPHLPARILRLRPDGTLDTAGIWRARPDGSDIELIAWGARNPYGMVFAEDEELYVTDNDHEETGDRAIANDPDRVWRIDAARTPHGEVGTPAWYGFADLCGDGLPVWHESHRPARGRPAEQLIADPLPEWAGPAVWLEQPLAGQVQGLLAGSSGPAGRDLRHLTLSNLDSMSAFAVAEQLGPALGRPQAVDVAFRVVSEKSAHQLLLREVFLEFAADAVLHRRDV